MTWWLKQEPLCRPCWNDEHPHGDRPNRRPLDEREVETCCACGTSTMSGIYALYRPAAVPYPTEAD